MKRAPNGTRVRIKRPNSILQGCVGVVFWGNHKHAWVTDIEGLDPKAKRLVQWAHLDEVEVSVTEEQ